LELIALKVSGWRRFATPQTLQTPGKLVAILGPNEAGKSSLLQALEFLRKNGVARPNDTSRGVARKQNSVTGYFFALAEEELKLCKLSQPTRLILTKQGC
jgi:AAA15 family ATPase/GTPase